MTAVWPVVGALGGAIVGGAISWLAARAGDKRRFAREDLARWDRDVRDTAAKIISLISRNRQNVARLQRLSELRNQSDEQEAEEHALAKKLYDVFVELDLLRAELALVAPAVEVAADAICRQFEETVEGEWLGEGPDGNQMLGQKVDAKQIPVMVRDFTNAVRVHLRVVRGS